jgi:hypothetical protein
MIKVISMHVFPPNREFSLTMNPGAQILRAKFSHVYHRLMMFVLADEGSPVETVKFRCYRTGQSINVHPADVYEHVSTFEYTGSVYHLFRVHPDAGEWPPGPAPEL